MKPVRSLIVAVALILASCSVRSLASSEGQPIPTQSVSSVTELPPGVDRHDPKAVLNAYFAAWARGDLATQVSFMDAKYARLALEPVDSLRLLVVNLIATPSSSERTYHVVFEIRVKGTGVSMQSGRYDWTYYLTWEPRRDSWLITNYGAG